MSAGQGTSQTELRRDLSERGSLQSAKSGQSDGDSFLSEVMSYSLDRLRKEPELLKQDTEQIKRRILETSVTQYEAFLAAERCLLSLHADFGELNETVHGRKTIIV